jgi:tetratricopeptide (TPR) repeat protein
LALLSVFAVAGLPAPAQDVESGVIRLAPPPSNPLDASPEAETSRGLLGSGERRGFDDQAFGARVESLWFQRKAYLAESRVEEALRQAELIRSFTAEEGVRRLEAPAGALVLEAERALRDGNHPRALEALHLAEGLDPGRSQVQFARARALWASGSGAVAALAESARALRTSATTFVADPARLQPFALVLFVAFLVAAAVFSSLMAIRYHRPLRHDVEEWMTARGRGEYAVPAGWAVLLFPLWTWIAAGWVFFYWIVATFRYMRRSERWISLALLFGVACSTPLYRGGIGLFGKTADPRIRTIFAAANGEYDPELIVRLRELVDAHPTDVTYRFLLGGLYKDGRFFEEAFEEYKRVLALEPKTWQAYVNIGNLYLQIGQYGEAIAQYRRALDVNPDAVIALMNTYHAQTESFRLNEAAQTLELARRIDSDQVARMLSGPKAGTSAIAVDATLDTSTVWGEMLEGARAPLSHAGVSPADRIGSFLRQAASPAALFAVLTAALALTSLLPTRVPARCCSRCGRPFCTRCKSGRDAPEYCSHCIHLFVLGAGLAPETKSRKMYEIEAHDRRQRLAQRLFSAFLPGSGEILAGGPTRGVALCLGWTACLFALLPIVFRPVETVLGLGFRLDVIRGGTIPPVFHLEPVTILALPAALALWTLANLRSFGRRREV